MAPFDSIQRNTVTAPITLTNLDIGFDSTLFSNGTWGSGTDFAWTFEISGTNPTMAFSDGLITITGHDSHLLTQDANLQLWLRGDDETGGEPEDLGAAGNAWTYQANAAQTDSGMIGKAFTFDGTGDFLDATSPTGMPTGSDTRSYAMWIKTSSTRGEPLLCYGVNSAGQLWEILVRGDISGEVQVFVNSGNISGSIAVNDGIWHHIAITSDGTNINVADLYIDGVLDPAPATSSEVLQTSQGIMQVGKPISAAATDNFTGQIDDIRVYDRELSAAEILQLFELGTLDAMTAFSAAYFTEYVSSKAGYFNRLTSTDAYAVTLTGSDLVVESSTDFNAVGLSNTGSLTTGAGPVDIGTSGSLYQHIYAEEVRVTYVRLNENATPSAITNDGALYTKVDNALYFQDGAGTEHLVHGDAFSNLWFHDVAVDTITIAAANTFVAVTSFDSVGEEDDLSNLVANTTNNDLTVGANGAGEYKATFHLSAGSGGAADEFIVVVGQVLATPITITLAPTTTPIVCTAVAHGMRKGDMVTISNGTGMAAINGDWFLKPITADTFTLLDLQGANSVGSGTYDVSTATVDIVYHGNILLHRKLAQSELGTGGGNADLRLAVSDKLKLYVANIGGTDDIDFTIVNMEAKRIGD